jgi:hypothetical protein
VLASGDAQVDDGAEAGGVAGDKGGGIEPEAGEGNGTVEAVGIRRDLQEMGVAAGVPENLAGIEGEDDVLLDTGAVVFVELWAEVDIAGGVGDFDDELGGAGDVRAFVSGLAAVFGEGPELCVGLDFALPA